MGPHSRTLGAGLVTRRLYRVLFRVGMIAAAIVVVALLQGVLVPFAVPLVQVQVVHLRPVWVIVALLAGARLLGLAGVFVSAPAVAVLGGVARFALALERYRASAVYDPHRSILWCRGPER